MASCPRLKALNLYILHTKTVSGEKRMKKLTCSLLTLSLALFVLTVGYAADTDIETLRAADVNSDGIIDILDLVLIASHFG